MNTSAIPILGTFPVPSAAPEDTAPCVGAGYAPTPLSGGPVAPPAVGFTARLLAEPFGFSPSHEAVRVATGLGLAATYGLALGARSGGTAFLWHAVGIPASILASLGIGVPALYIALALFDAPLGLPRAVSAGARAVATTGLVLAGLAPAAALFVVSSDHPSAASLAALVGLRTGFALGLACVYRELFTGLGSARVPLRVAATFCFAVFAAFAATLATRVGLALLPIFGGAR